MTGLDLEYLEPGMNKHYRRYKASKRVSARASAIQIPVGQGKRLPPTIDKDLTIKGRRKLFKLMEVQHIKNLYISQTDVITIEVDDPDNWVYVERWAGIKA